MTIGYFVIGGFVALLEGKRPGSSVPLKRKPEEVRVDLRKPRS